ncbi:MAG: PLP-dependent transferase, partial [Acidobacteriota bacterium]
MSLPQSLSAATATLEPEAELKLRLDTGLTTGKPSAPELAGTTFGALAESAIDGAPSSAFPPEATDTSPRTAAIRAGVDSDPGFGAVMPPLYLSSNFSFEGFGEQRRYDYTRSGNPTRDVLAETLAELEGGARAVVTSSGMSAIHLVLQLLEPGSTVVASYDCYGGTHRLLRALERRGQVEVRFADLTSPAARAQALRGSVDLVWIETPSNPLLRITDLAATAREAHALGALVAVDNTFLSPALQRPLDFGADLVVHSTTKYL